MAGGTAYLKKDTSSDYDFAKLREIRQALEERCPIDFNEEKAIDGYVNGGIDRYSHYGLLADDSNGFMDDYINTSNTAISSGFQVERSEEGGILLTQVTPGMAAAEAGLQTGDVIVKIDEHDIIAEGYENSVNHLLGKQDTTAELTIIRNGTEQQITFRRDNEYVNEITPEKFGSVGYVQVDSYDEFAVGQFAAAIDELKDCNGVIIDLRGNSGGNTRNCVRMLEPVCPGGEVFLNYVKQDKETLTVPGEKPVIDVPVVVMMNGGTKSAAETQVALIKQYYPDTTLLGENSGGKGVFQDNIKLESGGTLRYTVGSFTVGNWECWQGVGIAPDVEVKMDSTLIGTDEDTQLQKAIDLLS